MRHALYFFFFFQRIFVITQFFLSFFFFLLKKKKKWRLFRVLEKFIKLEIVTILMRRRGFFKLTFFFIEETYGCAVVSPSKKMLNPRRIKFEEFNWLVCASSLSA
ncbi:hypothetical protein CROQUDRAFT_200060 [Cronartium quercuum f. sp. fusiforme G11]|uniref:Uncharacterized protein n=1 Tax=Cronartium quercuum f. sp. fusiforme G11 TaxID=708437 RepID=A0A9P6NAT7_9BASI|nr:hypothetical protein CROQUDRAFT_200060 [Cronartium quercuum f. sp. fusiforme G11]